MIVSGSGSQSLAVALADETGLELAPVSVQTHPDGEQLVQVGDITDHTVVVASTGSDSRHIELLQLQDAVREAGASEVTTVIPYMGYARQDQAFDQGQPVSARAMARAISTGTDRVLIVNPHEQAVCDFFEVPAETIDGVRQLANALRALSDPLFLAPDCGAIGLAERVRDAYGEGEADHFEKTRHSGADVDIEPRDTTVEGRDVVLVDDIVATGTTMSESVAVLDHRGADRVTVTCVHPLLAGRAQLRLARAGVERVIGTDTIESPASAVTVAPAIADQL